MKTDLPQTQYPILSKVSYRPLESVSACRALNRVNGSDVSAYTVPSLEGCPPCDVSAYASFPACILNDGPAAASP